MSCTSPTSRAQPEPRTRPSGPAADIQVEHLDLDNRELLVSGKTGVRWVAFGLATKHDLQTYLKLRKQHRFSDLPWLWLGLRGRFTYDGIAQMVSKRGETAGLNIHPHVFRHTFSHLWLDGGGNESDLEKLAGWTPGSSMVRRYGASAASSRARRAYHDGRSPLDALRRR